MSYDPNWLQKEKTKQINADLKALTHIRKNGTTTLCGGYYLNGRMLIIDGGEPTCRTCRKILQEQKID